MPTIQSASIQIRRDTRANWSESNPVLSLGEIGICTDNLIYSSQFTGSLELRIGDGTSSWSQLSPFYSCPFDKVQVNGTEATYGTSSIQNRTINVTVPDGNFKALTLKTQVGSTPSTSEVTYNGSSTASFTITVPRGSWAYANNKPSYDAGEIGDLDSWTGSIIYPKKTDTGRYVSGSFRVSDQTLDIYLKNSSGTQISTSSVNIPISGIARGYVSESNLILVLVSGNTITIPLGSLVSGKLDSSWATNSSSQFAGTASYATNASVASYVLGSDVRGTVANASNALTASFVTGSAVVGTVASASNALTASYAQGYSKVAVETGRYISGSFNIDSQSLEVILKDAYSAEISKFNVNIPISGIARGYVSESNLILVLVSGNTITIPLGSLVSGKLDSSWATNSSSQFAGTATNALTASFVTGSVVVGTVANATNALTAGTAANASNALTASFVTGSAVVGTVASASNALTASFVTGSAVVGTVASASNALTASFVTGSAVSGTVYSASNATYAKEANRADTLSFYSNGSSYTNYTLIVQPKVNQSRLDQNYWLMHSEGLYLSGSHPYLALATNVTGSLGAPSLPWTNLYAKTASLGFIEVGENNGLAIYYTTQSSESWKACHVIPRSLAPHMLGSSEYHWADGYIDNVHYQNLSGPSDRRLKTNVEYIKNADQILCSLNPVEFDWNETAKEKRRLEGHSYGFIADEFLKIIPDEKAVDPEKDYQSINYIQVIPYLVAGYQHQKQEIEELKAELAELKEMLKK